MYSIIKIIICNINKNQNNMKKLVFTVLLAVLGFTTNVFAQ